MQRPTRVVEWARETQKTMATEFQSTTLNTYWTNLETNNLATESQDAANEEAKLTIVTRKRAAERALEQLQNKRPSSGASLSPAFRTHSNHDEHSSATTDNDDAFSIGSSTQSINSGGSANTNNTLSSINRTTLSKDSHVLSTSSTFKSRVVLADVSNTSITEESRVHSDSESEGSTDPESTDEAQLFIHTPGNTDSSYHTPRNAVADILPQYKKYILCYDEVTAVREENVSRIIDLTLHSVEQVLELSTIISRPNVLKLPDKKLTETEREMIKEWVRTCFNKKQEFFFPTTNYKDSRLFNFLQTAHESIIKEPANIQAINNQEEDFKIKYVVPLFNYVFKFDKFNVAWDVRSQVYSSTDTNVFEAITTDISLYYDGIEIGIFEVKPFNANEDLKNNDEIRVGEVSKKMLHKRMGPSRFPYEHSIVGGTIPGSETNLCIMKKENDEYNYYHLQKTLLPTFSFISAYMELVLEQMISFRDMFKETIVTDPTLLQQQSFIHNVQRRMSPTTLYYLKFDE